MKDEDFGTDGWMSAWIGRSRGFNVNTQGFGLVHDMLEHALTDTGTFHEELMAFGRMEVLRADSGVLAYNSPYMGNWQTALGRELHGIWMTAYCPELEQAPPIDLEDGWEHASGIVRAFRGLCEDLGDEKPDEDFYRSLGAWVQIGHRDALRRYGGSSECYELGWIGHSLSEALDERKTHGHDEGDVLRLAIDTDARSFQIDVREHYLPSSQRLLNNWMRS